MPILPDDDVVAHRDAERFCDVDDLLRHLDVGARGCIKKCDQTANSCRLQVENNAANARCRTARQECYGKCDEDND